MKLLIAIIVAIVILAAALAVGMLAITFIHQLNALFGTGATVVIFFIIVAGILVKAIYNVINKDEEE